MESVKAYVYLTEGTNNYKIANSNVNVFTIDTDDFPEGVIIEQGISDVYIASTIENVKLSGNKKDFSLVQREDGSSILEIKEANGNLIAEVQIDDQIILEFNDKRYVVKFENGKFEVFNSKNQQIGEITTSGENINESIEGSVKVTITKENGNYVGTDQGDIFEIKGNGGTFTFTGRIDGKGGYDVLAFDSDDYKGDTFDLTQATLSNIEKLDLTKLVYPGIVDKDNNINFPPDIVKLTSEQLKSFSEIVSFAAPMTPRGAGIYVSDSLELTKNDSLTFKGDINFLILSDNDHTITAHSGMVEKSICIDASRLSENHKLILDASADKGSYFVHGGKGSDKITTGSGDDFIYADDKDKIDGGDGKDTVFFQDNVDSNNLSDDNLKNVEYITVERDENNSDKDINIDLSAQTENLDIGERISADAVNKGITIISGSGNDQLHFSNNIADTINAGSGNDFIYADDKDKIDGGDGKDTVALNGGNNIEDSNLKNVEDIEFQIEKSTSLLDLSKQTENLTIHFDPLPFYSQNQIEHQDQQPSIPTATLKAGSGNDFIVDDWPNDGKIEATINAGPGNDVIIADSDDTINGGEGKDIFLPFTPILDMKDDQLQNVEEINLNETYGDLYDFSKQSENLEIKITGGNHGVTIIGGKGNDKITGSNFDDTIKGKEGADIINAGGGNDTIHADDSDTVDGGNGNDKVIFFNNVDSNNLADDDLKNIENIFVVPDQNANKFDLSAQTEGLNVEIDRTASPATVITGSGNDKIDGNGDALYTIKSGAGDDIILTNDLNTIDGGDGTDTVVFNQASSDNLLDDNLKNVEYVEFLVNESGAVLDLSTQNENLHIQVHPNFDISQTNTPSDVIKTGSGNDVIEGSNLKEEVFNKGGFDTINTQGGNDTIHISSYSLIDGGDGIDILIVSSQLASTFEDDDIKNIETIALDKNSSIDLSKQTEGFNIYIDSVNSTVTLGNGKDTVFIGVEPNINNPLKFTIKNFSVTNDKIYIPGGYTPFDANPDGGDDWDGFTSNPSEKVDIAGSIAIIYSKNIKDAQSLKTALNDNGTFSNIDSKDTALIIVADAEKSNIGEIYIVKGNNNGTIQDAQLMGTLSLHDGDTIGSLTEDSMYLTQ